MRLNEVEKLPKGSGKVDLFGFGHGSKKSGQIGIGLEFERKWDDKLSTFAEASIGKKWTEHDSEFAWKALMGARYRFK